MRQTDRKTDRDKGRDRRTDRDRDRQTETERLRVKTSNPTSVDISQRLKACGLVQSAHQKRNKHVPLGAAETYSPFNIKKPHLHSSKAHAPSHKPLLKSTSSA